MAIGSTLTVLLLVAFCAINVLGSIGDFGFPEAGEDDKSKQNAEVINILSFINSVDLFLMFY